MTSDSILEHLRLKMGCSYISDLRRLTGKERSRMLYLLNQFPKNAVTAEEWADIQNYLFCKKQFSQP